MKDFMKIITLSGAFLAFLIGSGVATGQEVMQYYSPYGFKVIGTAITIATILIVANYGFAYAGKKGGITKGSEVLPSISDLSQEKVLICLQYFSATCHM